MDFQTDFNGQTLTADWVLTGHQLAEEHGLRTAIALSLFTDARANDGDVIPDGTTDRRGWWGDVAPPANAPTDAPWRSGSRLWLLSREKQTAETARRAEDYCREALDWLTRLGVASRVEVSAEWQDTGVLGIAITITRADGVPQRWGWLWAANDNLATAWKDIAA